MAQSTLHLNASKCQLPNCPDIIILIWLQITSQETNKLPTGIMMAIDCHYLVRVQKRGGGGGCGERRLHFYKLLSIVQ